MYVYIIRNTEHYNEIINIVFSMEDTFKDTQKLKRNNKDFLFLKFKQDNIVLICVYDLP